MGDTISHGRDAHFASARLQGRAAPSKLLPRHGRGATICVSSRRDGRVRLFEDALGDTPLSPPWPPPPPPRPELMTGLFEDELGDSSSRSGCLLEQSHAEDAIGAGVVDAALALEVGDRLLMALRLASVHRASEVDGLDERVGSGLRERVPRLKVVLPRRGQRWVELVQPDGEVGCRRGDGGGGGGG